jgi:hypothetical protein
MDWSCAVLLIAGVTDTDDMGVNVTREVVEEAHSAHHLCERAAPICPRSCSATARGLLSNPEFIPLLLLFINMLRVYPLNTGAQPLPKAEAMQQCTVG